MIANLDRVAELEREQDQVPDQVIDIAPDGTLAFVYDDELAVLAGEGSLRIRRVSHVEPQPYGPQPYGPGNHLRWIADLRPVGGPVLGPYLLRSEALAAEREWLQARNLTEICGR